MTSFISLLVSDRRGMTPEWTQNPQGQWMSLPLILRAKFLVHQCVIMSYFDLVYDNTPMCLLKTYRDQLSRWVKVFRSTVDSEAKLPRRDDHLIGILSRAVNACEFFLQETNTMSFSQEDIFALLADTNDGSEVYVPVAAVVSFYVPYVHYAMATAKYRDSAQDAVFQAIDSFSTDIATIPSLIFNVDGTVDVRYDTQFAGYNFDPEAMTKFEAESRRRGRNWFQFIACMNLSDTTFNGIMGLIASQAIELDDNALQLGSISWLYFKLYKNLFNWNGHLVGRTASQSIASEEGCRNRLLKFLLFVRERYRIAFDDAKLMATLADQALKHYFNAATATEISNEEYRAFKASVFGKCEELDLLQNPRVSLEASDVSNGQTKTDGDQDEEESGDKPDNDNPDQGDSNDEPADDPQDVDDDDFGNADFGSDSDGNDPFGGDDIGNDSSSDDTSDDSHTPITPEDVPEVGDETGVAIDLSPGDTLDTHLFRVEVGQYIDAILSNPPKSISANKLLFLKKIRVYWLYILSVKSLSDLMQMVIQVPSSFKIKGDKK